MASPVVVSLDELKAGDMPLSKMVEAFGPESLGILIVKDLPPSFKDLRREVLSNGSNLASLSPDVLQQLEDPHSGYKIGWSCGKERLSDNKPDLFKGSYFASCAFHVDPALEAAPGDYEKFPQFTTPNKWPPDSHLPGFKDSFTELCNLMIDVAELVARACDRFGVEHVQGYQDGLMERIVKTSTTTKARLLHYFPQWSTEEVDDWCALHVDTSALTALTSAMFVDENEKTSDKGWDIKELEACPDEAAGLYIRDRKGSLVQVKIPRDCIAFQTGEALQIVTKGNFKAVPHMVRGCRPKVAPGVTRNTLAVFCQPSLNEMVGEKDFATFAREIALRNLVA